MKYKISIIIPAYNTEKYLEECIASIIHQTIGFQAIHVILINDGSTDHSGSIINDFAQKYDNIQAIHLETSHSLGGFARNEGLKKVQGQYVMFVDSDDCLDPNACKLMYDMIVNNQADIVTANYKCMSESGKMWKDVMFDQEKYPSCELKTPNEEFFYLYCPSACMKIFRTDLITKNHLTFLNGVPAEDAYFSCSALLKAKKVFYLQEEIYYYRRRNSKNISTSWMRNKKYFLGLNEAYRKIYECFKQANKMEYYKYFYAKNLISIIYKFIDSKQITDQERIELIEEMYWFWEQSKLLNVVFAQKTINILLEYMLSRKYEEVIKTCEMISEMRRFMNEVQRETMSKPEKIFE